MNISKTAKRVLLGTLRRSSVLVVVATVWAASIHSADAAPPVALEISSPSQTVIVGETLGVFEARIVVCADNKVDGFAKLFLRDGTALELTPVSAKLHFSSGSDVPAATIVYLPTGLAEAAQPGHFFVGTAGPSATEVGCDIWDFLGPDVQGGQVPRRVQFEAETTRALIKARCRSNDFGQFSSRAEIDAQRQTVFPIGGGDPLDFEVMVDIARDNGAGGFVDVPLSTRGGLHEIFFGTVLRDAEIGFKFFAVGALADPGDPLSTDDMLRATATPISANEDCLLWDLVNGSICGGGFCSAVFEAETSFKVAPPPK